MTKPPEPTNQPMERKKTIDINFALQLNVDLDQRGTKEKFYCNDQEYLILS
jgi:hypothetical protein